MLLLSLPKALNQPLLLWQAISRELDHRWSSQGSDQHPYAVAACSGSVNYTNHGDSLHSLVWRCFDTWKTIWWGLLKKGEFGTWLYDSVSFSLEMGKQFPLHAVKIFVSSILPGSLGQFFSAQALHMFPEALRLLVLLHRTWSSLPGTLPLCCVLLLLLNILWNVLEETDKIVSFIFISMITSSLPVSMTEIWELRYPDTRK